MAGRTRNLANIESKNSLAKKQWALLALKKKKIYKIFNMYDMTQTFLRNTKFYLNAGKFREGLNRLFPLAIDRNGSWTYCIINSLFPFG